MTIDTTILLAALTAAAGIVGTWLTMRGQMKSAEAVIIGTYTKLVNDLRTEIDRLNVKQAAIEKQLAELQATVIERDRHVERLSFALRNILESHVKAGGY